MRNRAASRVLRGNRTRGASFCATIIIIRECSTFRNYEEMSPHREKSTYKYSNKNEIYISQLDLTAGAASPGRSQETCGFQSVIYTKLGGFF